MAKQRTKPTRKRDTKKGGPGSGRRKPCLFCKDKIEHVDYKDVTTLCALHLRARQDPLAAHHRRCAAVTRARSPTPSSARASSRCCRTSPSPPTRASAAVATATGTATDAAGDPPPGRREPRRARVPSSTSRKGYLRNFLDPAQARRSRRRRARLAAAAAQRRGADERAAGARRRAVREHAELLAKTVLTIAQPGRRRRSPVRLGHDARTSPRRSRRPAASTSTAARSRLEEPIKHVGTYMVELEVDGGVAASVKTMVVAQ